jgi:hypothetical protein
MIGIWLLRVVFTVKTILRGKAAGQGKGLAEITAEYTADDRLFPGRAQDITGNLVSTWDFLGD